MDRFSFVEGPIDVDDYLRLRDESGWQPLDYGAAQSALDNSLYSINAVSATEVVGCGRVVGDGGVYYYIQDLIVIPEYRGNGLAGRMMDYIMGYLREEARPGAFVGLMDSARLSGFYVKYGFSNQVPGVPGMFRIWPGTDIERF